MTAYNPLVVSAGPYVAHSNSPLQQNSTGISADGWSKVQALISGTIGSNAGDLFSSSQGIPGVAYMGQPYQGAQSGQPYSMNSGLPWQSAGPSQGIPNGQPYSMNAGLPWQSARPSQGIPNGQPYSLNAGLPWQGAGPSQGITSGQPYSLNAGLPEPQYPTGSQRQPFSLGPDSSGKEDVSGKPENTGPGIDSPFYTPSQNSKKPSSKAPSEPGSGNISAGKDLQTRELNFNNANYIFGRGNVKTTDGGKAATIHYPKGSASPSMGKIGGASFQTNLGLPASNEMHLKYNVKFGENFDFRNGGKLPGLAGGAANSGGKQPTGYDGWSARIDFRKDGAAEIYAYLPKQSNPEIQAMKKGDKGFSLGRVEGIFKPGGTYEIEERVKMNTPGKSNGRLQLFVNGEKVVDQKGLVLSKTSKLKADKMMFSTFFGGSKNADRTTKNEKVTISNVKLSVPKKEQEKKKKTTTK